MKYLVRIALLVVMVVVAVGVMPQTDTAEAASCDVLHASANVWNSLPTPHYRLNGIGPGLPTDPIAIPTSTWTTISWTIDGPGPWSNLYMEYANGPHAANWTVSVYSVTSSCEAAGCDATVSIPSTAVVGSMTDNAAVYFAPGEITDVVLEVGKTFWMDGLDETGMYRKVLISCTWAWVQASKTGPNYDDVWNGTPLPGHTVD